MQAAVRSIILYGLETGAIKQYLLTLRLLRGVITIVLRFLCFVNRFESDPLFIDLVVPLYNCPEKDQILLQQHFKHA